MKSSSDMFTQKTQSRLRFIRDKQEKIVFASLIVLVAVFIISFAVETKRPVKTLVIPSQKPLDLLATEIIDATQGVSLLPRRFRVRLQKDESLFTLFERLQLDASEIGKMRTALGARHRRALDRLQSRTSLWVTLNADNSLKELIVMKDGIRGTRYWVERNGAYQVSDYLAEYTTKYRYMQGDISNSLYRDGLSIGMSDSLVINFAEVFAYDLDFANDVRKQDSFSMVLEDLLVDNRTAQRDIIALARFVNRGREIIGIRYTSKTGETGYFNPRGESLRTRFLRMPVKFSRISSGFNLRRLHPILNRVRPHRGTDFAAPIGTPINAAGAGVISFAGYKSGYGRTIIVNHGKTYSTLYAHMHRLASGMRKGKRVRQNDVIGYVGQSGIATGPHLHYEFRVNKVHRNPLTVKFPRQVKLQKDELNAFRKHSEKILALHEEYQNRAEN